MKKIEDILILDLSKEINNVIDIENYTENEIQKENR